MLHRITTHYPDSPHLDADYVKDCEPEEAEAQVAQIKQIAAEEGPGVNVEIHLWRQVL